MMDQKQSPAEGVAKSHLGGTQGSAPAAGTGIILWIPGSPREAHLPMTATGGELLLV